MRSMKLGAFVVTALVEVLGASAADAAQGIYDYTGNNFTSVFTSGYTFSDKITGTITFSSPLASSLTTLTDETSLVTSYSFSDGVHTFSTGCCDTGNQTVFKFMTDASGNITNWLVTLETDDNHTGDLTTEGGVTAFDQSLVNGALGGGNNGSPGVWTLESPTSAVPEPATWLLFLLGFGGIGWVLRTRRGSFSPARAR